MKSLFKRNFLITALMVFVLFACAYVCSGHILFSTTPFEAFTLVEAAFISGAVLSISVLYIALIANKKKPLKTIEIILIFACILLFLLSIYSILSYPENKDIRVQTSTGIFYFININIPLDEKLIYILQSLFFYLIIVITIIFIPRQRHNFLFIKIIYYLVITFAFIALMYSLCFEFNNYLSFIKDPSYEYSVKSFFIHRNNYGTILSLGVIASIFALQDQESLPAKILLNTLIGIFFIGVLFTFSKLNIIVITLFIFVYFVVYLIKTFSKHFIRNTILSALIFLIIFIGLTCLLLGHLNVSPIFVKLYNFFKSLFDMVYITSSSRYQIWCYALEIISESNIFIGVGRGLFNNILLTYNTSIIIGGETTPHAHNAYIELLGQGGILLFALYIAILIWIIYNIFKYTKGKTYIRLALLLFIFYIIFTGFFESSYLLDGNYEGLFILMMILIPCFALRDNMLMKEVEQKIPYKAKLFSFSDYLNFNFMFVYLLSVILFTSLTSLSIELYIANIIIYSLSFALLIPILSIYTEHYSKTNNSNSLIFLIIGFILSLTISVFLLFDFDPVVLLFAFILIICFYIPLFLSKDKLYKELKHNILFIFYPLINLLFLTFGGYKYFDNLNIPFDYFLLIVTFIFPFLITYVGFKFHQYNISFNKNELFSLEVIKIRNKKEKVRKVKEEKVVQTKEEKIEIKKEKIKEPLFIKIKLKEHYSSFYEKVIDIYKAFIAFIKHWWHASGVGKKNFQIVAIIASISLFVILLIIRDVFFIDIPNFVFVILLTLSLLLLNKKYVVMAFIFLISFNHALPLTYTMLVFIIVLFIKNECRINIAQIIIPLFIFLYEILMIILYQNTNYKDAITLTLFVFNISYILLSRNISLSKHELVYSYLFGLVLMLSINFVATSRMIHEAAVATNTSFKDVITNNYFRLSSPTMLDEWFVHFNLNYDFSYRDAMIGDDPNNLGYFISVGIASLFYIFKNKKKRFIVLNAILLLILLVFGVLTKSRTFVLCFISLIIIYFVILIIQKELSRKSLLIVTIVVLSSFIGLCILSTFSDLIKTLIWRFAENDGSFTNDRFSLIGQYYFTWTSNPLFRFFGSGVTNIYNVYNLSLMPHTGIIQMLCSYGLVGIIILGLVFVYIIYVRSNKRISMLSLLPFIAIFIFTLGLQIIYPYVLLLPLIIGIMAINNGSTINDKFTNNLLLTPLIYLGKKNEDDINEYVDESEHKWPTLKEFKITLAIAKLKNKQNKGINKIYDNYKYGINNEEYNHQDVDAYLIVNKKNFISKIYIFITKLIDKIRSFKVSKFINHKISQYVLIILGACLVYSYIILSQVFDINIDKLFIIIAFGCVSLFINRNNLIVLFAAIIPFSNGLPQRWIMLILLVLIIIKSKFRFTLAQLFIPFIIITILFVNVLIYGTTNINNDLGFAIIIFLLFYIALDKSFNVNVRKVIFAFAIGFIIYCLAIVLDMALITRYALEHATKESKVDVISKVFGLDYRLGELTSIVSFLNTNLKPDPLIELIPVEASYIDNANNIAYYAAFASTSCILLLKEHKVINNIFAIILAAICFYFGVWTGSRGFVVTIIVFIPIYIVCLYLFSKISKIKLTIYVLIFVALVGMLVLFDYENKFITSIFDRFGKGDPLGERGNIIGLYFTYFKDHLSKLWFGIGIHNVLEVTGLTVEPHTNILQILICFGIIGGLFIISAYIYAYFMRIDFKKINVFGFIPLIVAFVFSLSIQILSPYMIMYPFLISTLFINGGDIQTDNKFKFINILSMSLLPFSYKYKKGEVNNLTLKDNEVIIKLN